MCHIGVQKNREKNKNNPHHKLALSADDDGGNNGIDNDPFELVERFYQQ